MKNMGRRALALMLVLILTAGVGLLFASRKKGMFIDEVYTFGLSNSRFAPFLFDLRGGEIDHTVFTREELLDYMLVTGDEGFDVASVYDNQVHDVHPPLYYWLFNFVSTLAKGRYSMWPGLLLDLVLYLLCVGALYALARRLGAGRLPAAAAALLYGLSHIGLSTMLMIRMYVLLALLSVVLALLIAELMREFRPRLCVLVALTLLAGLMTQYYFVFYAFFLCAAYVLWALIKKDWRALSWFVPCALLGALALLPIFPAALSQLFSGELVSGESALDNLKNLAQYPARLRTFVSHTRHGLRAAILTGLGCAAALIALWPRVRRAVREGRVSSGWLVIVLPAFVTFVLVAIISPVDEIRYIYNIAPIFALAVGALLCLAEKALEDWKGGGKAALACFAAVAALALWEARCVPPDYLYPEHAAYNAQLAEHADAPCVVFAEADRAFVPMTEDLPQLVVFPEVYVTDQSSFEPMLAYVGDAEEIVIFVDVSVFWSSGYDDAALMRRLAAETDYIHAEPLFEMGLTHTWLLRK